MKSREFVRAALKSEKSSGNTLCLNAHGVRVACCSVMAHYSSTSGGVVKVLLPLCVQQTDEKREHDVNAREIRTGALL
jgi:hypothetical protein